MDGHKIPSPFLNRITLIQQGDIRQEGEGIDFWTFFTLYSILSSPGHSREDKMRIAVFGMKSKQNVTVFSLLILNCIVWSFCILLFTVFVSKAFANETGFRFPATCSTDGSSCPNMEKQDNLYNSWQGTQEEQINVGFTDFGIPLNAAIDSIQIKLMIKTSTSGWTWFTGWSPDNGISFYWPGTCGTGPENCAYNTTSFFNSVFSPTMIWQNTNLAHVVTGIDINSPNFRLKLFQSGGFKNTDIDVLLLNVKYHMMEPTPTPTITPTPTAPPGPAPFLDLPWDYQGKGMSFTEAATAINSYFDHEYPLLSSGLAEPIGTQNTIRSYQGGQRNKDLNYSSHDGYDYGVQANVYLDDPVLAAAPGVATYLYSKAGGNTIVIDHGSGYQTRYLHLQPDGLVVNIPRQKVHVEAKQEIGKVGSTGSNTTGPHIHFGVFRDKNNDGNFEDNIPDGATDPFGWQSKEPDPWESYSFIQNDQNHSGNKSYYLWKTNLDGTTTSIGPAGGKAETTKFIFGFPQNATAQQIQLDLKSSPTARFNNFASIGSTITATATDALGNAVTNFLLPFILTVNFGVFDLHTYNQATLSIYSSNDNGNTWTKENTTIDPINHTATAPINHLTQFALMAERKDATPPATIAQFSGLQEKPNWFRSKVDINLQATDNQDGSGVDYTLYKTEKTDWQQYVSPIEFTDQGHHKIEFYSIDKDGNVEEVKNAEFDIDTVPPEAELYYDLSKFTITVVGKDSSGETSITHSKLPKGKEKVSIIDLAGNSLSIIGDKLAIGKQAVVTLDSLQYNDNSPILLDRNVFFTLISASKGTIKKVDQYFQLKGDKVIVFNYSNPNNKTKIFTLQKGKRVLKETRDGIVLLKLSTENGTLKYNY